MNSRLMAFAVAGALGVPGAAVAQASNLQMYGYINMGMDNYSATGATAGSSADLKARNGVYENVSRLGLRGSEDVAHGLRAIWQIESGIPMDTGTAGFSVGTWASRNSYLGLQSQLGTVAFGRDQVWSLNGGWPDPRVWQDDAQYLMKNYIPIFTGNFGRGMGGGVPFRVSNLVKYTSPTWNNFRAVLGYAAGAEAQQANAPTDGRLYTATLEGAVGAFAGGWDYANNRANSPTPGSAAAIAGNAQGETVANKLRIGWTYRPDSVISLLWVNVKQRNGGAALGGGQGGLPEAYVAATGAGADLQQTGWGMEWKHLFGNIQPIAQWGRASNIKGCSVSGNCANTSSTIWTVGARYVLSRRTWVYASYATINNASNANMDFFGSYAVNGNGTPGLTSASVGADPRVVALGMVHIF